MLTSNIDTIISDLSSNKAVSIPTDTVYGLSCTINKNATNQLMQLKHRDTAKGFIIISNNIKHLLQHIKINKLSPEHIQLLSTIQSTPTTWIAPAGDNIGWLTGNRETIAVRLVDHEIINIICDTLDSAIISTSANISGQQVLKSPQMLEKTFTDIAILDSSPVQSSTQSKIINLVTGDIIR